MSILIENILCKHWIKDFDEKFSYTYHAYDIHPHKVLDIRDSIHFNSLLKNDFSIYEKLISSTNQYEHSVEKFKYIRDNFNLDDINKIKIEFNFSLKKYIVLDGLHRIVIMYYTDRKPSIGIKYLDISYDQETVTYLENCMKYTTGITHYNGWNNRLPYHTLQIGDTKIQGQRNSYIRIEKIKKHFDFSGKNVLDLGCNIGINLLCIPEIKNGFGFDYDERCIETSKNIRDTLQYNNNTQFFRHNFDTDTYETLSSCITFIPDIIFVMSMGSWVNDWKKLYEFALMYENAIIMLETNNDDEGVPQLEFFKEYCSLKMISDKSEDDFTGNHRRKLYLMEKTKKTNVFVIEKGYHPKNLSSLLYSITYLGWTIVNTINEAEIVFSPNTYIDITQYGDKKFIFGPHFDVFPNDDVRKFDNIYKNAIYIQPSQQSITSWQDEFKFTNLPMDAYAFGVDTDKFSPDETNNKNKVILYYKDRDPVEYEFIKNYLESKGVEYTVFDYRNRYNENDFIKTLKETKYCIWLGTHESQGFALEETLSMNVPILVWNVTLRLQQHSHKDYYKNVKSKVTTIPYWDERCGEYFYNKDEFEDVFNKFSQKLNQYKPREFVLENLSMEKRTEALAVLVNSF